MESDSFHPPTLEVMASYINKFRTPRFREGLKIGLMSAVRSPLAVLVMLIIALVFAGLTLAASISGALTAAAVSAAGFFVIILILVAVNTIGKGGR